MPNVESPTARYQRILFCTDFPEGEDYAFEFALDMARQNPGCTLFLLHVIPETDAQFWRSYLYEVEDIDVKAKQDIDSKIQRTYRSHLPPGLNFQVEFRIGKDYLEILDFSREKAIDLIVIGREGKGVLHKALFGKVAEKIARKAECAVLIVPRKSSPA